jgi:hypothetical protein
MVVGIGFGEKEDDAEILVFGSVNENFQFPLDRRWQTCRWQFSLLYAKHSIVRHRVKTKGVSQGYVIVSGATCREHNSAAS